MGVQLSSGHSAPKRANRRYKPMSEINVTPLVDVMLVLLIVFMVAAPLLTVGVPVELPETAANALPGQDEPLAVTVDAQGRIYVQDTEVVAEEVVPLLLAISNENRDLRIFLRADRSVEYGTVLGVMGRINRAGFTNIGMVSEPSAE